VISAEIKYVQQVLV